jgi:hypothetical protein
MSSEYLKALVPAGGKIDLRVMAGAACTGGGRSPTSLPHARGKFVGGRAKPGHDTNVSGFAAGYQASRDCFVSEFVAMVDGWLTAAAIILLPAISPSRILPPSP